MLLKNQRAVQILDMFKSFLIYYKNYCILRLFVVQPTFSCRRAPCRCVIGPSSLSALVALVKVVAMVSGGAAVWIWVMSCGQFGLWPLANMMVVYEVRVDDGQSTVNDNYSMVKNDR